MKLEKISIGRRGSMTIPAKIRRKYGLSENDELIVEETAQGILLRPAVSMAIEMYSDERIAEFGEDDSAVGAALDRLGPE